MSPVFALSPRLTVWPVVHGSGDFALEVVRRLKVQSFDCVAVPIPASFEHAVEDAVSHLPQISVALMAEEEVASTAYSFVPIDPCQAVITAIRYARNAGITRAYIDLEVPNFEECAFNLPDPHALKFVSLEQFGSVVVPFLKEPPIGSQRRARIRRMAYELHCLELEYENIVFVCDVTDWPWVRQAYQMRAAYEAHHANGQMAYCRPVSEEGLYFVLGELPYITYLYEHRRAESLANASLSVDGIKMLLLDARTAWQNNQLDSATWLTSQRLGILLQYVRNLTITDRRLTPDLYNLALAAKQVVGDEYALNVIQKARIYPPQGLPLYGDSVSIACGRVFTEEGVGVCAKNRLPGIPKSWRKLSLKPVPREPQRERWRLQWDPFGQCSYPPEDKKIESFQQHVRKQALQAIGDFDSKTEKFTASLKDGLDLRETLRNWHSGGFYVKEYPLSRGKVEVVVFIFESPVNVRRYPWRGTWYAEHKEESTLSFFATAWADNIVGPGIGQATYGGCLFLYPPRAIPDLWTDPRFEGIDSSPEHTLIRGALFHSVERRIVLVSPNPPLPQWRKMARQQKKQIVHVPLKRFSPGVVDRLRQFHVLNGREVRSYASKFIRDFR